MKLDWNNILAYNTAKIVTIRDARLGLLHYGFMLAIVIYILVFTILIEQKYLLTERPIGSIRLSLLKGKAPVELEEMLYCQLPNRTTSVNVSFPCIYQDELFVVFPETEATAMLATTRYTYMQEELNCSLFESPYCAYNTTSSNTYFIADIEHFTLLIDHTVYAPIVGIKENAKSLKGSMSYFNGSTMHLAGPPNNVIGEPGLPDIIQLQTLLQGAGITSLDSVSQVNASSTLRYDGLVLMIFIVYSNTKTYNLHDVSYTYMPTLITGTEFKSVEPILGEGTYRQVYNRHGIRMIFVQDGLLGKFDFQTMLLTFVSGLGLLTVSTIIVDMIAIYLLPQKKVYEDYKYQRTDNFRWSPLRSDMGEPDEKTPIQPK